MMGRRVALTFSLAFLASTSGSIRQVSPYHTESCDATLWEDVYTPARLVLIDPCVSVSGTIIEIEHETDGDDHILLLPDQGYEGITDNRLFGANIQFQKSALVTEAIPVDGELQNFGVQVGDHVQMSGSLVYDTWHHNWLEIHPITSVHIDR